MNKDLLREIVQISSEVSVDRIMLTTKAAGSRLIAGNELHFEINNALEVQATIGSGATPQDIEVAQILAQVATLAIENSRSTELKIRLQVDAERFRIARDLHDRVLQRIFATGMSLEGALRKAVVEDVITSLKQAIIDLDETVGEIRTTVYSLKGSKNSIRNQILSEIERARKAWNTPIDFNITGPVDTLIDVEKHKDVLAVTAELLNNAGRHGDGERIKYSVTVDGLSLEISVKNGGELSEEVRFGQGLENCNHRALKYGGKMVVEKLEPGLHILWNIPL